MSQMNAEDRYQKLLQSRANRLGVSLGEAENAGASDELFLGATKSVVERLGKSPAEILREDFKRLEASAYPTDDCLTPAEIEDLVGSGASLAEIVDQSIDAITSPSIGSPLLTAARLAHLRDCSGCRLLLTASRPKQALLDDFQRHVEALLKDDAGASVPSAASLPPRQRPRVVFAEGALAGVMATLAICFVLLGPLYSASYKLVEPVAEAVRGSRNAVGGTDLAAQKLGLAAALGRSIDLDASRSYQKGDIVYVLTPGSVDVGSIPLVVTNPKAFNLAKDELTKDWKPGTDLRIAARDIGLQPLTGEKKGALTTPDLATPGQSGKVGEEKK